MAATKITWQDLISVVPSSWAFFAPAFLILLVIVAFRLRDAIAVFNAHQRKFGLEALSTDYWSGQNTSWRLLVGSIPVDMNPKSVRVILTYRLWMGLFFANLFCIFIFANKS